MDYWASLCPWKLQILGSRLCKSNILFSCVVIISSIYLPPLIYEFVAEIRRLKGLLFIIDIDKFVTFEFYNWWIELMLLAWEYVGFSHMMQIGFLVLNHKCVSRMTIFSDLVIETSCSVSSNEECCYNVIYGHHVLIGCIYVPLLELEFFCTLKSSLMN